MSTEQTRKNVKRISLRRNLALKLSRKRYSSTFLRPGSSSKSLIYKVTFMIINNKKTQFSLQN